MPPANKNRNDLLVPGSENAVDQMKTESANEFNVELGADTTARDNRKEGGEIVKQMIQIAEESIANRDDERYIELECILIGLLRVLEKNQSLPVMTLEHWFKLL